MTAVFSTIAFLGVSLAVDSAFAAFPNYCTNSYHHCQASCGATQIASPECDPGCVGLSQTGGEYISCWDPPANGAGKITEIHTCGSVQATCIYDTTSHSSTYAADCAALSPPQKYDASCLSSCPNRSSQPIFPNACVPIASAGNNDAPSYCTSTDREYHCIAPSGIDSCDQVYPGTQSSPICDSVCTDASRPTYCYKQSAGNGNGNGNGNGGGSGACGAGFEKMGGVCFPVNSGLPDPQGGILQILNNFFAWLLLIFGLLSLGAFMVSGIQYLIASGDEDLAKTAKRNMKFSLVGIIVGLSGYVIMQAVFNALSANPFF